MFAKTTKSTIEFEAIFRAAENESEMIQFKSEKTSIIDYKLSLYSQRKNYSFEIVAAVNHANTIKLFLKQRNVLNISDDEISYVIKIVASNFH